jgi:hypothetical protein
VHAPGALQQGLPHPTLLPREILHLMFWSRMDCGEWCTLCAQVAMMFLSRGELFHEATWEAWFRSAAGLIPAAYLRRNATCTGAAGEAPPHKTPARAHQLCTHTTILPEPCASHCLVANVQAVCCLLW